MIKKISLLLIMFLLVVACQLGFDTNNEIDDEEEITENSDILSYNVKYELFYDPIQEEGDRFSYLILAYDGTFSMSVNTCDAVEVQGGEFFVEDDILYLVPEDYYCDLEEMECDLRGITFYIKGIEELEIVQGLRCISEGSVFKVN